MKNLVCFFLLLLCTIGFGQPTSLPEDVVESIHQRIEKGLNPAIVVGIIDANGPKYYNFGLTKAEGKPVDEHSIFEIGSVTKTFTGILLADMSLKGKLSINDPASKFLPETVRVPSRNGAQITLGHLSDHTSSLPRMPDNFTPADQANPYADYSVDQMYAFLSSYELMRDIGSEYEYSNFAQGLLGHILALQAGKSYEELMIKTIADPLGMQETRIVLTETMRKNLAYPHSGGAEVSNWDIPALAGAGAIRSSAHDMLKYLGANLGLVTTSASLSEAIRLSHIARHQKGGSRVGLGWHIVEGAEGDVITHNGGTGGYSTFVGFVKETGRGVVVFTNCTEGVEDIGFRLLSSTSTLASVKAPIAYPLRKHIDEYGPSGLSEKYQSLKATGADEYDFNENDINSLGYYYLGQNNVEVALALFKINTEEYPSSFNVWDSYAEGLMMKGEKEAAITFYKKSLEMNPGNTNGISMLAKMGVTYETKEVRVSEDILQTYVGSYALTPDFHIVITREGKQLYGQATGQGRFEMYPSSETEFYLKVVAAQIKFNKNEDGSIKSLTLYQGGQVIEGIKG